MYSTQIIEIPVRRPAAACCVSWLTNTATAMKNTHQPLWDFFSKGVYGEEGVNKENSIQNRIRVRCT